MKRWLLGKTIDGKYHIDSYIGGGNYGNVFCATEFIGNTGVRKIALKVIKQMDQEEKPLEEYFKDCIYPAMILGKSGDDDANKHIVQIYNWGISDIGYKKTPFIAMELVENCESLKEQIDRNKRLGFFLDEKAIVDYAVQLLRGLALAHNAGVLHRDLKPANILVRNGNLKITDFGVGIGMLGKAGVVGDFGGDIYYMSPEGLSGAFCFGSDVYSIGLVIYELWHNMHPFYYARSQLHGKSADNSLLQVRIRKNWRYRAGKAVNPLACDSEKLYEIIKRCLIYDTSQRYENANEVLKDLQGGYKTRGEKSIDAGTEAFRKGEWKTAVDNLEAALKEKNDNATRFNLLEKLGYAYKELGLINQSLERFKEAVDINERYKLCCATVNDFKRRDKLCRAVADCYERLGNAGMARLFRKKVGIYSN